MPQRKTIIMRLPVWLRNNLQWLHFPEKLGPRKFVCSSIFQWNVNTYTCSLLSLVHDKHIRFRDKPRIRCVYLASWNVFMSDATAFTLWRVRTLRATGVPFLFIIASETIPVQCEHVANRFERCRAWISFQGTFLWRCHVVPSAKLFLSC